MLSGKKHNSKTDIWSAGCVVFELITLVKFNNYLNSLESDNHKALDITVPEQLEILVKMYL